MQKGILRGSHVLWVCNWLWCLLHDVIELNVDVFGKRKSGDQTEVLIGVEPKSWVDEKGKRKAKARLKKIMIAKETKKEAQRFVDETIEKDSMV